MSKLKNNLTIFSILLIALVIRLYRLDSLPAEMWGDTIEHYKYAKEILEGRFFINHWFGGDGPLFSYLITAVAKLFGLSFYSLKLTTVFIGLGLVIAVYYYAKAIFNNKHIGYISAFLAGTSFWSFSFSRQGKPYMLVGFLAALIPYLLLKNRKILAGVFIGFGIYTQASFWGGFIFSFYSIPTFISFLITSFPFLGNLLKQPAQFLGTGSYIGSKFFAKKNFFDYIQTVLLNIKKNIFSFLLQGDSGFRHTIPNSSHLDIISAIFFLLGFVFIAYEIIKKKKISWLFYLILPFCFIQIPSILDVVNPTSTPNMGRMIGVLPYVFTMTGYGIFKISNIFLKKKATLIILSICFLIGAVNIYRYFIVYPKTLPNENMPFGKIIAGEIDKYPEKFQAVVIGCCWGQWGQPEPNGIRFQLKRPRNLVFFEADDNQIKFDCKNFKAGVEDKSFLLFFSPLDNNKETLINACFPDNKIQIFRKGNTIISKFIVGRNH